MIGRPPLGAPQDRRHRAGVTTRLLDTAVSVLGDLECEVTFATNSLALDDDVWVLTGMDLGHFRAHPSVLYNHDHALIVGRASQISVTASAATARVTFPPAGVSQIADQVRGLVKAGTLTGVSAGIIPLESQPLDPRNPRGGQRITKSTLLEFSFVSIPCDVNSTVTARGLTRRALALDAQLALGRPRAALADLCASRRALICPPLTKIRDFA